MRIIIFLIVSLIAAFSGLLIVSFPPNAVLVAAVSVGVFIFAFLSTKLSLVFLLFSMLLSPEISVGVLSGSRYIVFRYDDIFLVIIFLSWFFKTAISKNRSFITETPLLIPLIVYTSVFIISTSLGIVRGDISFLKSFFYVLKYVEYFLLYFMCVNVIEKEDIHRYLKYWLWIFIAVTVYAYYYYFNMLGIEVRATAPFEAPLNSPQQAEPASLGGFYILAFSFFFSIIANCKGGMFNLALLLLAFAFPAFLFTFSRASYMGIITVFLVFLFFGSGRRIFALLMTLGLAIFVMMNPNTSRQVKERIKSTYSGEQATHEINLLGMSIKLEESAYLRYHSLKKTLTVHLPKNPIIGKGVTGVGLGDSQYALLFGEVGILGFFAFCFIIFNIYKMAYTVYKNSRDPIYASLGMTAILSVSGLLVQGLGVNTFIIVRIMEPFWFIMAVLTVMYGDLRDYNGSADKTGAKAER